MSSEHPHHHQKRGGSLLAREPGTHRCPQEPRVMVHRHVLPVKGNSCGTNGKSSERVTQGRRNDSAPNVKVTPSAGGGGDARQMASNGTAARRDRNHVIKELGTSSTAFIGPACRPKAIRPKAARPKAARPKADIEDELSEFYKELEKIEPEDSADGGGVDGSSTDPREPRRPRSCEREGFTDDRGGRAHRGPRPYRYDHNSDHWRPKRLRPNFPQGPSWHGPNPPFYPGQWPHSQAFGGPRCPPYQGFFGPGFRGPPGLPPPFRPFFPPDFGPQVNTYRDNPEDGDRSRWESAQFPPVPGCPPFDGFGHREAPQDYGNPLDGRGGQRGEGAWTQPYEGSDWDQDQRSHPGPGLQQELGQEKVESPPPHLDCDYRPDPLPVLILMRGVPGSGKSTLARKLLSSGRNGLVLSTDDYFSEETGYSYHPSLIGNAHDWNQNRAREAMDDGRSPVVIDNTNVQAWEMKPYVKMALERGYSVDFSEPDTSWKSDPSELEKRNKHGVPSKKIAQMLERFELPVSVDIVLSSEEPPHKSAEAPPSQLLSR